MINSLFYNCGKTNCSRDGFCMRNTSKLVHYNLALEQGNTSRWWEYSQANIASVITSLVAWIFATAFALVSSTLHTIIANIKLHVWYYTSIVWVMTINNIMTCSWTGIGSNTLEQIQIRYRRIFWQIPIQIREKYQMQIQIQSFKYKYNFFKNIHLRSALFNRMHI